MTPPDEQKLERAIHQALRELPNRRAPASLEHRVRAAIEQGAPLPWWRQGFGRWPLPARVIFLGASLAVMAVIAWLPVGDDALGPVRDLASNLTWLGAVGAVGAALADFFRIVIGSIPPVWLYGGLALVAGLYATLFGLGAAAYRALRPSRQYR
jgi:hypothetical protein